MNPLEEGLLVPLGASRGQAVHVGALALGGLSIEGAEAHGVLRQMILSLAADADPEELKIFAIGASALGLDGLPHVAKSCGWEDAGDLLQEIQAECIRRARALAEAGVEDAREQTMHRSDELLPALAVIAVEPPPTMRGIVEAIGRQARRLGGVLFALGWRPEHAALPIIAQSTLRLETDLPVPHELEPFTLDEARAADAIRVIGEAQEDAAESPSGPQLMPQPSAPRSPGSVDELPKSSKGPTPVRSGAVTGPQDLQVRCLGHYQVLRNGEVLAEGWRTKSRELLAYLVAHEKGAPKERIIEDLWPGLEPARGQKLFELASSFLRTNVRTDNASRYVEKVGDSFRLQPEAWWVDTWEFARLIEEAFQNRDPDQAQENLREALTLYEGEFCDDTYYEWARPVRERYRALFVRACGRLAEVLSSQERHEEALGFLERAIEIEPLCEDLWRRAMLAEAALGRSAAAVDRYNRLKSMLAGELEVEPDPETQRIRRQLEVSQRPAAGEGSSPESAGTAAG